MYQGLNQNVVNKMLKFVGAKPPEFFEDVE
jgi:hypothetical protein